MKTNQSKLEGYVLEQAKKKNGGKLCDEREMQQTSGALVTGAALAMIFDCVMMAFHFIRHNTEKAYPYLAQLLVMCAGFALASLGQKQANLPKTFYGKPISPEKSGKAYAKRLVFCALESAILTVVITIFNIYDGSKLTGELITDSVISFVIFTLLDTAFCEYRVHRWRKFQAELDAEEDDLAD